jgi:hypothetical protein
VTLSTHIPDWRQNYLKRAAAIENGSAPPDSDVKMEASASDQEEEKDDNEDIW